LKEIFKENLEVSVNNLPLLPLVSLDEEAPLKEAYPLMQSGNTGSIVVTKFDVLVGIVTERDFLFSILGKIENFDDIPIKEVMTKNPITIKMDSSILSLIKIVSIHDFRHIPIIDEEGCPVNIVSVRDLVKYIIDLFPNEVKGKGILKAWNRHHLETQPENFYIERGEFVGIKGEIFFQPLGRAINDNALILDESSSLQDVLKKMQEEKKGAALLVEYETRIKGILTERDFLLKVVGKHKIEGKPLPVKDFMTSNPDCLLARHILSYALNNMFEGGYRNIVIVNEDKHPISIISMLDIFKYICDHMIENEVKKLDDEEL
jgi:CBS domain-containing protein